MDISIQESTLPNQLEGKWQSSSKIMTRSRSSYQTAQREMPYSKGSLGKVIVFLHRLQAQQIYIKILLVLFFFFLIFDSMQMTQNVKNLLSKAQGNQALQSLIKHSHSLLR